MTACANSFRQQHIDLSVNKGSF